MTSTELRRSLGPLLLTLLLAGCGLQPFHGTELAGASFLSRTITQSSGPVTVSVAVPDARETLALTGLDLYEQGIQPVWLRVDNHTENQARVALSSIDRDYFSPIEVAYMNRRRFSGSGYADMEKWFHDNRLRRMVPSGTANSGLVYTHLRPGTKGFNLDIFSGGENHSFTFFVPMPGFEADYTKVKFESLYSEDDIRQLDRASLVNVLLEELPCCAHGPDAGSDGGPINVVVVASPLALRRGLLRGGWLETQADREETEGARAHKFDGRGPDGIFYLDRPDGNERINLHLWLSPWRMEGTPVWVGQVYYREIEESFLRGLADARAIRDSAFLSRFMRESVVADIDSARRFLLQNLWYNQSLEAFGTVSGVGVATENEPLLTFDGIGYFTDGERIVLILSDSPVGLDEVHFLNYEEDLQSGVAQ